MSNELAAKKRPELNKVGWVVLLLGCTIALFIYWIGSNAAGSGSTDQDAQLSSSYSDAPLTTQDSKRASRDVAIYSGQLGVWMAEWSDWVAGWRPSTIPALIVAGISVVGAFCCFAVANRWV